MNVFGILRIKGCLLFTCFFHPNLRDSFLGHSVKCIYHAYISHVSRYSLDQKKVSSRSRLGHSRVSSRSRFRQFGKRLGLVSVSGAQVSVLVSVSTQKVLGPSLLLGYEKSSRCNPPWIRRETRDFENSFIYLSARGIDYVYITISQNNPQMPKVKIHLRTPKGGWVPPPLDFGLPVRIFQKYFSWVCFRGQGIQRW